MKMPDDGMPMDERLPRRRDGVDSGNAESLKRTIILLVEI